MTGEKQSRDALEGVLAGLRRASAVVEREIVAADHHQVIKGLSEAKGAIFDEIKAVKAEIALLGDPD